MRWVGERRVAPPSWLARISPAEQSCSPFRRFWLIGALIAFAVSCLPAIDAQAQGLTVPSVPQDVVATPGDGEVTLRWAAPARDGGAPVLRYEYTHWIPGDAIGEFESAGSSLTVTIAGLVNGTDYSFAVRAVNRAGTLSLRW